MKLLQLNIWQGRLIRQVIQLLQTEQPDVVCLQEVYSSDLPTPLFDFFSSFEAIQAALPGYHGFFSPAYDIAVLGQQVRFGNTSFSRYPIIHKEAILISGESHSYKTFDTYVSNTRNLQRITFTVNDRLVCLINHHGYWDATPLGNEVTVEKMKKVAEIAAHSSRPLILAGDLNIVPSSPAMHPLQAQLQDLTQVYDLKTTLTQLGKVSNVACDHIMISSDITVQEFRVSQELVSDHTALIAELDI